jgi:CBS domain-containing protein
VQRLPFVHPKPAELATKQHATAQLAADLRVDVPVIDQSTPLRQAIATMLDGNHKILAVVDSEKRLVGVLDRADVLHGLTLEHDVSV